jgi:hypothetical protein
VGRVGCAARWSTSPLAAALRGTPVLVPGEASRQLQPRGDTAGDTDGDSCVREDRQQVSSSTGKLSGGLVGGMKHGLELGECVLRLPPREANLSRGSPGGCQ